MTEWNNDNIQHPTATLNPCDFLWADFTVTHVAWLGTVCPVCRRGGCWWCWGCCCWRRAGPAPPPPPSAPPPPWSRHSQCPAPGSLSQGACNSLISTNERTESVLSTNDRTVWSMRIRRRDILFLALKRLLCAHRTNFLPSPFCVSKVSNADKDSCVVKMSLPLSAVTC